MSEDKKAPELDHSSLHAMRDLVDLTQRKDRELGDNKVPERADVVPIEKEQER